MRERELAFIPQASNKLSFAFGTAEDWCEEACQQGDEDDRNEQFQERPPSRSRIATG